MNTRQIQIALGVDDVEFVRETFRALVDFPHEHIDDDQTPDELLATLDLAAETLKTDQRVMPSYTREALGLAPEATYAQGVKAAKAQRAEFEARFRAGSDADREG